MASKTKDLQSTIIRFYNQPVAKVSLELFLSIGAVIFFAIFAIRPTILTMSDLIKEIEDKRKLDTQLAQKVASLSSVQTEYLNLQSRLGVLDVAIPSTPNLEEVLKILEKVASDQKLVISSIQVNEIPNQEDAEVPFEQKVRQNLTININVTGDYQTIRNFVEQLRNSQRAFIVEKISFTVSEERGRKILKATITTSAQYFGKPAVAKTSGKTSGAK